MGAIQLFHATLDGARELKETPFHREKDLQGFIEKHLRDLFGIEFLVTEYLIGSHNKQRIDTLGIDNKGRPVVIEYKLLGDRSIITQGLGYLDKLRKHPDSIRVPVLRKYGPDGEQRVDLKNPRLLCIAGAFTPNDIVAAEKCTESVELVRYCRYGDSSLILEWVFGGEARQSKGDDDATRKVRKATNKQRSNQAARGTQLSKEPDFSIYTRWEKAGAELRQLFTELHDYVIAQGEDIRVVPVKYYISFKRKRNVVDVHLQTGNNRMIAWAALDPDSVSLQEGFTRDVRNIGHPSPNNLEITIHNREDLEKAKHLLLQSYQVN